MSKYTDILKNYCRENALRYTPEREVIADEIYKNEGHFDVDHLFFQIRSNHPKLKLAKASIYRNIPHLINAGLIRESFHNEGQTYYEHTLGHTHHDHMKCLNCGKIFEFFSQDIDKIQQSICNKKGFILVDHTHILLGYCKKCSTTKKEKICRAQKPNRNG